MTRFEIVLPTIAENLALDEALLVAAESSSSPPAPRQTGCWPTGALRVWSWPQYAVIVGAGGKLTDEVHLDRCDADGIPVLRRSSGGGTVLLGPGCLLYSLILPLEPPLDDLNGSYRFIMGRIAEALSHDIGDVACAGSSDLVWRDRKVSGNSQQRKRTHLLHHGTLLHGFDLPRIVRYIKHPPRMPDYRRDREHGAFVANLPLSAERLRELLANAWEARDVSTEWPRDLVAQLVAEKYGCDEWRRRRV